MKRLIIVMGGSTGAGKTTHGKLLKYRAGDAWHYVSTGDIARSMMDKETDSLFKEGQLSPHEHAIRKELYDQLYNHRITIVDGFPRLQDQYDLLLAWADKLEAHIFLIWLMPSREVLEGRWKDRRRDDYDNAHAAMKRDELYQTKTLPVLEQMEKETSTVVIEIGEKDESIQHVHKMIVDALESFRQNYNMQLMEAIK